MTVNVNDFRRAAYVKPMHIEVRLLCLSPVLDPTGVIV